MLLGSMANVLGASVALAQRNPGVDACMEAYTTAQRERKQGALEAARGQLLVCARHECPEVLTRDCARWLDEVEASQPTIVPALLDADGRDVREARVEIDGVLVAPRTDGRAHRLDPGEHRLRVTAPAEGALELRIVAREGEKNRRIELRLPPRKSAPRRWHVPTGSWVLGGVSAAALGTFAALGISTRIELGDAREACRAGSGPCGSDVGDPLRNRAIAADAFLVGGLVALGAGAIVFLTKGRPPPPYTATLGGLGAQF